MFYKEYLYGTNININIMKRELMIAKIKQLSTLHSHKLDWDVVNNADETVLYGIIRLFRKVYYEIQ